MKRSVYTFRNVLLLLLSTVALTTCTIIDNDLRDLPDNPAYREVVHVEGEGWEADYQYQPWTKILDEGFMGYVANVDFTNYIIYLHNYIPDELLPHVGDILTAAPHEKIKWGLSHKVIDLKREGSLYAVYIKPAEIKEVFKHLVYDQEANYIVQYDKALEEQDSTTRGLYFTRAGDDDKDRTDFDNEQDQKDWAESQKKKDPPYSNPSDPAWSHNEKTTPIQLDIAGLLASAIGMYKGAKKFDPGTIFSSMAGLATSFGANGETHKYYTINFHNFTDEFSVTGGNVKIDANTNVNQMPNPSFYFNGKIAMDVTFTPVITTRNYINTDENKFECYIYTAAETKLFIALAAELGINVNLWSATPASVCIGAPIGLPLWFEVGLSLDWYLAGEVNYSAQFTKVTGIKVGAKQNIEKHDDKTQYISELKNPPAEFTPNEEWNSDATTYGGVKTGLKFSVSPTLTLGFPEKATQIASSTGTTTSFFPNLQLKYAPSIGLEGYLDGSKDENAHNDVLFHVGVPVSLTDVYLIANLTSNFSPQVNIGEKIAGLIGDAIGVKSSKFSSFEIWKEDFRLYPSVDDLSIICTNTAAIAEAPAFQIDFNINNLGALGKGTKPCIKIYRKGETTNPLYTIDDFPVLKASDKGSHFTRTFKSDNLKRDEVYTARVEYYKGDKYMNSKKMLFTSRTPTAFIEKHNIYHEESYFKIKDLDKYYPGWRSQEPPQNVLKASCYGFKFRTRLIVQEPSLIDELGFYVNGKKYVAESKGLADLAIKGTAVNVYWQITNSKEPVRSFEIIPYLKQKGSTAEVRQIWHEPYKMTLDYYATPRDPEFGTYSEWNWSDGDVTYHKPWRRGDLAQLVGASGSRYAYVVYGIDQSESYEGMENSLNVKKDLSNGN